MTIPDRLILVDGTALIYRAYHAIPTNLATVSGLPTNAIYGFATMFRKVLAGRQPKFGAVVFDAPGPTFRNQQFPAYKAQRPPMDESLRQQLPWIDRVVAAHHFPMLRRPGYEADDVIGTLTRQAVATGLEVFIVSGDKDFAQLVSDQVRMVDTLRDVVYDPELVRKKWGVTPEQFVDLLAMMGDKIDNIPGVPGIGQKGAGRLLAKYGSLDAIFEHLDEISGRARQQLEQHRDQAQLSRTLATIDVNVPLDVGLEDLRLKLPKPESLNPLFKELEFYSLLSDDPVGSQATNPSPSAAESTETAEASPPGVTDYASCLTLEDLDAFLATLPTDTPTAIVPLIDAFLPVRGPLAGLALCGQPTYAHWIPLAGLSGLGAAGIERLRPWLEDPSRPKITHGSKNLRTCLLRVGIEVQGVVGDTQLESFLVEPTKIIPHGLGQITREFLQQTLPSSKQVLGAGKRQTLFTRVATGRLTPWACQRADAVLRAWPILRRRLDELELVGYLEQIDLPLASLLAAMELDGIAVDPTDLRVMGNDLRQQLQGIEEQIFELAGSTFNVGSLQQLGKVLFEDLGLPVLKRTKSGYSTDVEVLTRLAPKHDIATHVLEHRKLAKLINTYTDVLQLAVNRHTGRIHTTFQQTHSATGRLISTEPDLQRTPARSPEGRRIRRSFVPRPGHRMVSADWSQIELRLLAHATGDPLLTGAFVDGRDIHRRTAAQLFNVSPDTVTREQRDTGKLVNFATIYGQGASALGFTLGVSRQTAQTYIDSYFDVYHGVRTWLDQTIAEAHDCGYATTLFGRRRYIPELSSNSHTERQYGERIAANTTIQGSAADLCKLAMLTVAHRMEAEGLEARLLLQIHDELLFEAPASEVEALSHVVRQEMEGVYPLRVPLVVDVGVGGNWTEAH